MSAVMDDARPHVTSLAAAINLRFVGSLARAYDFDDVPGTQQNANEAERTAPLPDLFAMVNVIRSVGGVRRMSAQYGTGLWRASIQYAGSSMDEARWVASRVSQALNGQSLNVGDTFTTPIEYENGRDPEWRNARYVGTSVWTYGT